MAKIGSAILRRMAIEPQPSRATDQRPTRDRGGFGGLAAATARVAVYAGRTV